MKCCRIAVRFRSEPSDFAGYYEYFCSQNRVSAVVSRLRNSRKKQMPIKIRNTISAKFRENAVNIYYYKKEQTGTALRPHSHPNTAQIFLEGTCLAASS